MFACVYWCPTLCRIVYWCPTLCRIVYWCPTLCRIVYWCPTLCRIVYWCLTLCRIVYWCPTLCVSYTGVQDYAVSYVFTFLFQCCDTCYVYSIKRFLVHSYPPFFVGGLISYVCYLCLFVSSDIQHVLTMSCMAGVLSIKDRSCLLFIEHLHGSPPVLGVCVANYFFISFCCLSCGLCAQRCQYFCIAHS